MSPELNPQPTQTRERSLLDQILAEQAQVGSRYQPVMTVKQAIERREAIRQLKELVLVEGEDYGVIPGTGTPDKPAKPTLYKPGAEKICAFFGYVPNFEIMNGSIEDWSGERFGEPLFYYHVTCTLAKDGHPVGSGTGSCSSWERKYRYRAAKRTCPQCGAATLIKGKTEWEKGDYKTRGSFICFEKKGGCGAKYYGDDPEIMNQPLGEVANPDFADIINTVQKMADKRAYVAATLSATGASQWFSQDLEDQSAIAKEAESIDTGGAPVGTRQAAANVAQRKIEELKAAKQAQQQSATVTEIRPADPAASTPARPAPWGDDMSRMFKVFGECKEQLGEPRYREILKAHQIKDRSQFKALMNTPIPAAIYWEMAAEIEAKIDAKIPQPSYDELAGPSPSESDDPATSKDPHWGVFQEINALAAKHRIGPVEASVKLAQMGWRVASQVPRDQLPLVDAAFAEVAKARGGAA